MVGCRVSTAYALWFVGGWAGLHLFYLGRHLQATVWVTTGNMLGIGWLRDAVRIPDYVRLANGEPELERHVTKIMHLTRVPPIDESHIIAMLMLGTWYYYVVSGMSSFIFPEQYIAAAYVVGSLAMSVGVWAAGSCGRVSCSLNHILFVVITTSGCFSSLRLAGLLPALAAAVFAAVSTRQWRHDRDERALSCHAALATLVLIGAFTSVFAWYALRWGNDAGLLVRNAGGRTTLSMTGLNKRFEIVTDEKFELLSDILKFSKRYFGFDEFDPFGDIVKFSKGYFGLD